MARLFRCRCNAVSSPEIATNEGDYRPVRFHEDPNDPTQMICDDCFRAVEEVNSEWMNDVMEDEFNLEFEDEEYEDEDDE